jgi:hypothetical protein
VTPSPYSVATSGERIEEEFELQRNDTITGLQTSPKVERQGRKKKIQSLSKPDSGVTPTITA